MANVLQFQLQKGLCLAANQYDPSDLNKPLYRCDIYQSPEAGAIMKYESGSHIELLHDKNLVSFDKIEHCCKLEARNRGGKH